MIDIALDKSGDLAVNNSGDLVLVGGTKSIIQAIKFKLADSEVNKMLGDPLNSVTLGKLEGRIKDIISFIIPSEYFKIRSVPIARDEAAVFLKIYGQTEGTLAISIAATGITFTEE